MYQRRCTVSRTRMTTGNAATWPSLRVKLLQPHGIPMLYTTFDHLTTALTALSRVIRCVLDPFIGPRLHHQYISTAASENKRFCQARSTVDKFSFPAPSHALIQHPIITRSVYLPSSHIVMIAVNLRPAPNIGMLYYCLFIPSILRLHFTDHPHAPNAIKPCR